MRRKQVSKRRWRARMMRGLWMPRLAVEGHSLSPPDGFVFVWHPTEDFLRITDATGDDVYDAAQPHKRAWE